MVVFAELWEIMGDWLAETSAVQMIRKLYVFLREKFLQLPTTQK